MIVDAADAVGSREIRAQSTWTASGRGCQCTRACRRSSARDHHRHPMADLRRIADAHEIEVDPIWGADKLATELFGEIVEELLQPTFVCDYPAIAQPLPVPTGPSPATSRRGI